MLPLCYLYVYVCFSMEITIATGDAPTVEYTLISTIRASGSGVGSNLTPNVLFGLMVYGGARSLQVYNAGLWVSVNWTCVLQGK